jgi:hypothetical protein
MRKGTGLSIMTILSIVIIILVMCSSCGIQERIPVITEYDGNKQINWYSDSHLVKKVIAKDKDNYGYFLVALEDGTTYHASFGEWSLIEVNDLIRFKSSKMYKIDNIIKQPK